MTGAEKLAKLKARAHELCQSGKYETGEGSCACICLEQSQPRRKPGCSHALRVMAPHMKAEGMKRGWLVILNRYLRSDGSYGGE